MSGISGASETGARKGSRDRLTEIAFASCRGESERTPIVHGANDRQICY